MSTQGAARALSQIFDLGASEERRRVGDLLDELFEYDPARDSYRPRYQEVSRESIRRIMDPNRTGRQLHSRERSRG